MKIIACYFNTQRDFIITHPDTVHYCDNEYGIRLIVSDDKVIDTLDEIYKSIIAKEHGTQTFLNTWFNQTKLEYEHKGNASVLMPGYFVRSRIHIQNITESEAAEISPHTQMYADKYMAILSALSAKTDIYATLVHFCAVSKWSEATLDMILNILSNELDGEIDD
ncbi:hypothetical protein J6A31_09030 [bacterium]|nr:hypothetical protein [bacterium]